MLLNVVKVKTTIIQLLMANVMKIAKTMTNDQIIVCTVSGRGDKDVAAIARYRGVELYE